jgi:hypothetical protein
MVILQVPVERPVVVFLFEAKSAKMPVNLEFKVLQAEFLSKVLKSRFLWTPRLHRPGIYLYHLRIV